MKIRRPLTESVADAIVEDVENEFPDAEKHKNGLSAIEFSYFSETEHSIHGPRGEARSLLVPYFL
jgi:hypothetical protein